MVASKDAIRHTESKGDISITADIEHAVHLFADQVHTWQALACDIDPLNHHSIHIIRPFMSQRLSVP